MVPDDVELRIQQSQSLKTRITGSCLIDLFVIFQGTALYWYGGWQLNALLWLCLATSVLALRYFYTRLRFGTEINRDNVDSFLFGSCAIAGLTGLTWSGFAIYQFDFDNVFSVFVGILLISEIGIGGMSASAAYRNGYLFLLSFGILPLGVYLSIAAPGELKWVGIGMFVYFAFGLLTSAQAQSNIREANAARATRKLADRVLQQNEIIRKAAEEKNRFLAATSHDLAQPLHAQGYMLQALKKKTDDPEMLSLIDDVEASWRNQGQILQGLSDITRLDTGAIKPRLRVVQLNRELESLVREQAPLADEKNIEIRSSLQSARTRTDRNLFLRLVRNILNNAIKFTPRNGAIDVELNVGDDIVTISVSDNGIGIPKDKQELVFSEYVQLQNPHRDRSKGLGLGLSIARRLARLLNIEMELASETGVGTRFTLKTPAVDQTSTETVETEFRHDPFETAPLILLVDDEMPILQAMKMQMAEWKCDVLAFNSAASALAGISEGHDMPDLLIVDKWLGQNESGTDLIRLLREETNENIPAILMTGDLTGLGSETLPDVVVLYKPVDPMDLRRAMQELVER